MKLLRIIWRLLCLAALIVGLAVTGLVFYLSSAQHNTSKNLGFAEAETLAVCTGNTTHAYAVVEPDGSVRTVGGDNVAFDLRSTSGIRSAGVSFSAKNGMVVKKAAISSDTAGAKQVGAATGTNVSSVRVGQLNRSTVVKRADACVGKAGLLGHIAGVAHVIGKTVATLMLLFIILVFGAGYELCRLVRR